MNADQIARKYLQEAHDRGGDIHSAVIAMAARIEALQDVGDEIHRGVISVREDVMVACVEALPLQKLGKLLIK